MSKVIISPSILSADFANLGQEVRMLHQIGAEWVHVDVMDGHFVPNLTIGPDVVKAIRPYSALFFDVHLMIEQPLKYAQRFQEAGADLLTLHVETLQDVGEAIAQIRALGIKVGLSICPETPSSAILPWLKELDLALIMTVHPGFGGQSYIEDCTHKIFEIAEEARCIKHTDLVIQVDGGINEQTSQIAKEAGANCLVAGSAIFRAKDRAEMVRKLRGN